jgi:hypothetical protein
MRIRRVFAALIVVSGWLRDGLPDRGGERRKAAVAFDLDGIFRSIRKADGAAMAGEPPRKLSTMPAKAN